MPNQYTTEPRPIPLLSDDGLTARLPLRNMARETVAYVTIDAADVEWMNQWNWCLDRDGYVMRGIFNGGKGRCIKIHRAIMGLSVGDGLEVDHINRDKLDNRRANLRIVPKGSNVQNMGSRVGSSSRFRGVTWNKRSCKWQAQLHGVYLGMYESEVEAGEVARKARAEKYPYAVD